MNTVTDLLTLSNIASALLLIAFALMVFINRKYLGKK
jgi:hypothetical protein